MVGKDGRFNLINGGVSKNIMKKNGNLECIKITFIYQKTPLNE